MLVNSHFQKKQVFKVVTTTVLYSVKDVGALKTPTGPVGYAETPHFMTISLFSFCQILRKSHTEY